MAEPDFNTRPDHSDRQGCDLTDTSNGPESVSSDPPWGNGIQEEMLRLGTEYERKKQQAWAAKIYRKLDAETAARAELDALEACAVYKTKVTNDGYTLLRWMVEDSPGMVQQLLEEIVLATLSPHLQSFAKAIARMEARNG